MGVDIKFCGMTRRADVERAASLGASYVGVIFAGGPREIPAEHAAEILRPREAGVRAVGVFADQSPKTIASIARTAGLDVVQLHGASDVERIDAIRDSFSGEVWPVVRVSDAELPPTLDALFDAGDAVVVDALVAGRLGGTGVPLPWESLARSLNGVRQGRRLVLAGGLKPENVAAAIAALGPDVVDVSSGVESAPGVKDHDRMRAFRDAVAGAAIPT